MIPDYSRYVSHHSHLPATEVLSLFLSRNLTDAYGEKEAFGGQDKNVCWI